MEVITPATSKEPAVQHEIHPLLRKRWSPRSFSEEQISGEQLNQLFEAARWAASANNEQPWQYVYAHRGSAAFEQLWGTLMPGNQPWTAKAAVLLVAIQRETFAKTGKPNLWAAHDVGQANAQLILQAAHQDIYGHMMAGFNASQLRKVLDLTEDQKPVCVIALGYLGEADALDEPYRSREQSARSRQSITEFTREL